MSSGLAGALNREMSNADLLFCQWKNAGEVAMTPPFGNRSHGRIYYMFPRHTEESDMTADVMYQCLNVWPIRREMTKNGLWPFPWLINGEIGYDGPGTMSFTPGSLTAIFR